MPLRRKQLKFIEEYLVDFNGTQAAIRAGYRPSAARAIGSENLTKPDIIKALAERTQELQATSDSTPEKVLAKIEAMLFGDEPTEVIEYSSGDEEPSTTKKYQRLAAAEKLGRYHKLFIEQAEVRHRLSLEDIQGLSDGEVLEWLETLSNGHRH